jgi:hypothetical protein
MRHPLSMFVVAALLPFYGHGQTPPSDTRPLGKYLVKVCSWTPGATDVTCLDPAAVPPPEQRIPQSIDFKQVASGSPAPTGDPAYPLAIDTHFWVSAKATSGLPVNITVVAGAVTQVNTPTLPPGTFEYQVDGPGTVVLRAAQPGDGTAYQQALPVTLVFDVGSSSASSCEGLFPLPKGPRTISRIDASGVVGLIGAPVPYVLAAQGPNTILIYSTRYVFQPTVERVKVRRRQKVVTETETKVSTERMEQDDTELETLADLTAEIRLLLGRSTDSLGLSSQPFSVELKIPHAVSLGDLAARLGGLNYTQFTVADVGRDKVRISAPAQPDCTIWTAFLNDVRHLTLQLSPESSTTRLYYVGQDNGANGATQTGASDIGTAFGTLYSGASASPAAPAAAATAAPAATPTAPAATTAAATPAAAATPGAAATPAAPAAASPPATPAATAAAPAAAGAATTPATTAAPSTGGGGIPQQPAIAMAPLETDLLVFASSNPGDDEQVTERKRIIAQLDLPRPEMIINGWVLQNSTTNPQAIGAFSSAMKELVGNYNERYEAVVLHAWASIKGRIAAGGFFDDVFYHYISDRYIGDTHTDTAAKTPQDAAQQFLDSRPAKLTFPSGSNPHDFGICDTGHYCLGYVGLFQPLKPRLTDSLLALVAAKNPLDATIKTIRDIEAPAPRPTTIDETYCDSLDQERRQHCHTLWKNLGLRIPDGGGPTCENADLHLILWSQFSPAPQEYLTGRVYLRCFEEAARKYLRDSDEPPTGAGLMRAAVANFLFQYKVSQQYPHEFYPYDLSQSADTLNSAISPLIDAFNRDVTTFQRFVRGEVQRRVEQINTAYDQRCCVKRLFSLDKPSFFNDGIITVRTVSGQWTYASSTSQSFLNASAAPKLTDVLNSLTTPGGTATPTGAPPAPINALIPTRGALGSAQLAASFLNNYQTTFAQIGRSLAITAIPRSLATASSAEIVVSLNLDDQAGTGTYLGGPQNGAPVNLSRVANADTSTRVRIDSVKLFEISSASAVLERSHERFPLLPPFVELPYIGTIAGIPLPPAKEYHQSVAFLSALVVPTAADIAYGLQFQFDEFAEGEKEACSIMTGTTQADHCSLRRVLSVKDFGSRHSIEMFNRMMVHCLATDQRSGYSSIGGFTPAAANACSTIAF